VYGPSLPTMLTPSDPTLRLNNTNGLIVAPLYMDVKLMSFGFSNPYDPLSTEKKARQSTIMRGPMASRVIQRLATDTDWGELDYLVVDFPPGTGDIQLTLAQTLQFASAVVVTTPQRLAHVDVVKGIDMFDKVNVPVVGLVENMAYLDINCECDKSPQRIYPFGQGKTQTLAELFGLENKTVQLPIMAQISEYGDRGDPVVLSESTQLRDLRDSYLEISQMVVQNTREIIEAKTLHGMSTPKVEYDDATSTIILTKFNGEELRISAHRLRQRCKSAGNTNPELVSENVKVNHIHSRGNYAVSIAWSDGHNSIFPYDAIENNASL